MPRGNFNLSITSKLSPQEGILSVYFKAVELGEKLLGGEKSEAVFAAREISGLFLPRGNDLPLSDQEIVGEIEFQTEA